MSCLRLDVGGVRRLKERHLPQRRTGSSWLDRWESETSGSCTARTSCWSVLPSLAILTYSEVALGNLQHYLWTEPHFVTYNIKRIEEVSRVWRGSGETSCPHVMFHWMLFGSAARSLLRQPKKLGSTFSLLNHENQIFLKQQWKWSLPVVRHYFICFQFSHFRDKAVFFLICLFFIWKH